MAPYKEKTGKFHFDFQRIVAKVDFVTLGQITTRLTGTLTSTKKGYTIEARLAAYNDTYDFDPKINGRDIAAELATRVFSTIENGRGTPFEIAIVGERFIKLSGLWDTLGLDFTPRLPRPTV